MDRVNVRKITGNFLKPDYEVDCINFCSMTIVMTTRFNGPDAFGRLSNDLRR